MTRENNAPWFTKAGAATSIVPLSHFVGGRIFALKSGGYGCLFSLEGIDPESRTDEDLDVRVRGVEAALRGLPQGSCLYQYARVISGFDLPRQEKYSSSVTESFASDRVKFLNQTARFRRIDLHWCLTIEPDTGNPLARKPKEQRIATDRQLFDLEKAATILESHMSDSLGLKLLDKDQVFQFFSYLFNLEEWASDVHLRSDDSVDRQLVHAPVEWHSDHLRIGRRYVQMFPLINTPEISRPCLFTNLMELDCDSILCSVWRPRPDHATRKEVSNQEKFLEFFKLSPFQRLMSGRNTAPLENTATAKAVASNVDNLSEVVSSLDKLSQGAVDFSQATTEHPTPATIVAEDHHAVKPATDTPEKPEPKDAAIDKYDFDTYDGKLYRIFEGSVFEGVVTNHIDGGLSGPILIMLTTDYYSHDHQQLLLPQGTRLIGSVQAVNSSQARKMVVAFHRAICPDGFSVDLDKFAGLDPLGTTGLATKVDNRYFQTFAVAAAIGGLGGLAQIGNNNILDPSAQIRNGVTSQTSEEGEQILNHFLNRLPIITLKEGSRARVYIGRDILIPSYAEHRVEPAM